MFRVSHKDVKVLLFIRPPFMALLCYLLWGRAYFTEAAVFFPASLLALIVMIITWRFHIYADHFLRERFYNTRHTGKRLLASIVFHFGIASVFITALFLCAHAWHLLGYRFTWGSYLSGLLVGLCTNLAATGFHEGVYTFESWKKTIIEAEELKKLILRNRLTVLRNQTNPHFFFNSINTLSGLIEVDTEKADKFLNEMCIVYRHLLRNEHEPFVPLHTELNFLRSWIYLVEVRYDYSVKFEIKNNADNNNVSIPRLTLLAFLEYILNTHIIDKNGNLKININIHDDVIKITHPFHNRKTQLKEDVTDQVDEVKTMYRLLGLPEIEEKRYPGTESIIIPLYHLQSAHQV